MGGADQRHAGGGDRRAQARRAAGRIRRGHRDPRGGRRGGGAAGVGDAGRAPDRKVAGRPVASGAAWGGCAGGARSSSCGYTTGQIVAIMQMAQDRIRANATLQRRRSQPRPFWASGSAAESRPLERQNPRGGWIQSWTRCGPWNDSRGRGGFPMRGRRGMSRRAAVCPACAGRYCQGAERQIVPPVLATVAPTLSWTVALTLENCPLVQTPRAYEE